MNRHLALPRKVKAMNRGVLALIVACIVVVGACGDPRSAEPAAGPSTTAATAPSADGASTASRMEPELPVGTGVFIDASMTRAEFEAILAKDGYTDDRLIADDAFYIDVGVDEPFADRDQILGEPETVRLVGGYVIVDGVVVVTYQDGTNACHAPVAGATSVRDGIVYVELQSGFKPGVEECIASSELWRATLVVPEARHGMEVRQEGSDTALDGVSPPLIEDLRSSLIFPDELPAIRP